MNTTCTDVQALKSILDIAHTENVLNNTKTNVEICDDLICVQFMYMHRQGSFPPLLLEFPS